MIVSGCLTVDDAYLAIEWKAVFLMVGMLPLGTALQKTGVANFLAGRLVDTMGGMGPQGLLAGIFLFNLVASQVMSSVAAAALIDHQPAAENVPRSLKGEGHEVLEVNKVNETDWWIIVRKG